MDRGCQRRAGSGWLDECALRDSTRYLMMSEGRALVGDAGLLLAAGAGLPTSSLPIYLGRTAETGTVPRGTDVVLLDLDPQQLAALPNELVAAGTWMGLRDAAAGLSALDAGLFVEAAAITNWHRSHRHCPRCGAATVVEQSGWVRRCPADDSEHFPRTDPAIIVTIVDDRDRLLLGSSAQWPTDRYSTLAGFVEPGESLEAAVIREIGEEAGIEVHSPQYLGSQPWPFPGSLMLGYTAHADAAAARAAVADGVEIRQVRWFTREELTEAVRSGDVQIAGGVSIARRLIEHWYGGPIAEPALEAADEPGADSSASGNDGRR